MSTQTTQPASGALKRKGLRQDESTTSSPLERRAKRPRKAAHTQTPASTADNSATEDSGAGMPESHEQITETHPQSREESLSPKWRVMEWLWNVAISCPLEPSQFVSYTPEPSTGASPTSHFTDDPPRIADWSMSNPRAPGCLFAPPVVPRSARFPPLEPSGQDQEQSNNRLTSLDVDNGAYEADYEDNDEEDWEDNGFNEFPSPPETESISLTPLPPPPPPPPSPQEPPVVFIKGENPRLSRMKLFDLLDGLNWLERDMPRPPPRRLRAIDNLDQITDDDETESEPGDEPHDRPGDKPSEEPSSATLKGDSRSPIPLKLSEIDQIATTQPPGLSNAHTPTHLS